MRPSKVLSIHVENAVGLDRWPYDDPSDPFWSFGEHPIDYRWIVEMSVSPQRHSSPLTRRAYYYDGMDISVGDWISGINGTPLLIVRILKKDIDHVTAVVEDVERINAHNDPTGSAMGMFTTPSAGIAFEINETGVPILDPLPLSGVDQSFFGNVMSRFTSAERWRNFHVHQDKHGFEVGDIVSLNGSVYVKEPGHEIVGRVTRVYDVDNFSVDPVEKIMSADYLPGNVGDILYLNDLGSLNRILSPDTVMLVLRKNTQTIVRSTVPNPPSVNPATIIVNGIELYFDGTPSGLIDQINATTIKHGIVAETAMLPTTAESSYALLDNVAGEPMVAVNNVVPRISINGTVVAINLTEHGFTKYQQNGIGVAEDISDAINRANIPDIVSNVMHGNVVITNESGGDIILRNIDPDSSGRNLIGPNSAIGIEGSVSLNEYIIVLTASDARPIDLYWDDPLVANLGLYSAENGEKAYGLMRTAGGRKASTVVVPTIADRNNLQPLEGDQCFVRDTGHGSWGQFLFDGLAWVVLATKESARVDAITLKSSMDRTTPAKELGRLTPERSVTSISVVVKSPFDQQDYLTIGDSTDPQGLMTADMVDLTVPGEYEVLPHKFYADRTAIVAQLSTQSTGLLEIVLTYQ